MDYHPWTSIKVQALADFLVKIPDALRGTPKVLPANSLESEARKDIWELQTDSTSSKEGSSAGLILKKTQGR